MTSDVIVFDRDSMARARAIVRAGGLIVYPTDTVYGLGCDPTDSRAVGRLIQTKMRQEKPISILCSSIEAAMKLVEMNATAHELAERFWPGALTIVAPLKKRELPYPIHLGTGTLGVRVPSAPLCVDLIESCGGWLTGTSANLSGSPPSRTAEEAANQIGDSVDLILDGGRLELPESTVVRVVSNDVQVLRMGSVGVTDEMKDR